MLTLRKMVAAASGLAMGASLLAATPAFAASSGASTNMKATAYGPSAQDNYPYGATNYFGQPLTSGDIAVDPSVIPLGSCVKITGYHSPNLPQGGFIAEANDEGNAIQGKHIDIFLNVSESLVNKFGVQHVHVKILGPKSGNSSVSGTAACSAYALGASGGNSHSA